MQVLEIKPIKNRKVIAYVFTKENSQTLQNSTIEELESFIRKKSINFVTIDFDIDMHEFSKTQFAKTLESLGVKYFQVDIPEFPLSYLYQEILDDEKYLEELVKEYLTLENKNTYKAESLKIWIDVLNSKIQEEENQLSLELRPLWIVKRMLDLTRRIKEDEISFVHFVQTDICEDTCPQVVKNLRKFNVKVIQYNKKHTIQNIKI